MDTTSQSLTASDSSSAVSSIKVEETRLQEQQPPKVKEMLSESSDTTRSDLSTSASGVSSSTQTYSTSEKVLPVSSQVESLSSVMSEDPSSKETDVIVIKTLSNLGGTDMTYTCTSNDPAELIFETSISDDISSMESSTVDVNLVDKVRNIGSLTKSSRTVPSSKQGSTVKTSERSTSDSSLISDIVIEQDHLTQEWVQKSHEIHSDSSDTRSSSSKSSSEKSKSSTRKSISSTSTKVSRQSTKVHDDTSSIDKSSSSHTSEAVVVKSLYEKSSSVPSVQDTSSHLSTVDSTESLTMSIEGQLKSADDETDFSETSKGYITESIVSPDDSSFITSSSSRLSSEVSTESSSTRKSAVSEEYSSTHTSTSTDDHVSSFSDSESSSEADTSTSVSYTHLTLPTNC